jgi:hypothetical protein
MVGFDEWGGQNTKTTLPINDIGRDDVFLDSPDRGRA